MDQFHKVELIGDPRVQEKEEVKPCCVMYMFNDEC